MNTIKFSHEYFKLPEKLPFKATLLQVFRANKKELSKAFLEYDTRFLEPTLGFYPLPDGELIVLLFEFTEFNTYGDSHYVFTTVRRFTSEKYSYYRGLMGQVFDCVKT